jgi:hypothetical protein
MRFLRRFLVRIRHWQWLRDYDREDKQQERAR